MTRTQAMHSNATTRRAQPASAVTGRSLECNRADGARPLRLRVILRSVPRAVDAAALFARLTEDGTHPGSVLLESGDLAPKYSERSIGVIEPSLCLAGTADRLEVRALDDLGRLLLEELRQDLVSQGRPALSAADLLSIEWPPRELPASFEERLRDCPQLDVLRTALPHIAGETDEGPDESSLVGLYGCFAYDFVRHFEPIPAAENNPLGEPDFIFYLATRLFVIDHIRGETTLVAAVPADSADHDDDAIRRLDCMVQAVEHAADTAPGEMSPRAVEQGATDAATLVQLDDETTPDAFCSAVVRIKEDIAAGRVFQCVLGRMASAPFTGDAFAVYRSLKRCNPSPYLFYLRDERGVLMGASPETAVRVIRDGSRRMVEIKPIAGTRPRGRCGDTIDPELDARLEVSLKLDPKELAEHTMLIDLARNDVAGVSKPGTTRLESSFAVEKYSHVQHLVSRVRGELRDDLDAFDAYAATMNMGTLTGAPKPEAMRIIAELERSARGFFGGAVGFLTADGGMETAIVIRAMRFIDGRAYLRAGAGVVADSIPENEWLETQRKMDACLQALREASHG